MPAAEDEEGRDGRGACRGPAAQAEQPGAPVDGQRPQGEEQVDRPAEDGVGVGDRADDVPAIMAGRLW